MLLQLRHVQQRHRCTSRRMACGRPVREERPIVPGETSLSYYRPWRGSKAIGFVRLYLRIRCTDGGQSFGRGASSDQLGGSTLPTGHEDIRLEPWVWQSNEEDGREHPDLASQAAGHATISYFLEEPYMENTCSRSQPPTEPLRDRCAGTCFSFVRQVEIRDDNASYERVVSDAPLRGESRQT